MKKLLLVAAIFCSIKVKAQCKDTIVLPVKFSDFTAKWVKDNLQVKFSNEDQTGVAKYLIQTSEDGIHWINRVEVLPVYGKLSYVVTFKLNTSK